MTLGVKTLGPSHSKSWLDITALMGARWGSALTASSMHLVPNSRQSAGIRGLCLSAGVLFPRLVRTNSKCMHGMYHHAGPRACAVPPLSSQPLTHLHANPASSQVGKGRGSATWAYRAGSCLQGNGRGCVFQVGAGRAVSGCGYSPPPTPGHPGFQAFRVARPSPPLSLWCGRTVQPLLSLCPHHAPTPPRGAKDSSVMIRSKQIAG